MVLEPAIDKLLRQHRAHAGPTLEARPIADARREFERFSAMLAGPGPKAVRAVDTIATTGRRPGLPVRIYRPPAARTPTPALLYLHGGGFTVGSIESHDRLCRDLALAADLLVVSVDYRLAPEHPFPHGLEDCYAAWCWLDGRLDGLRVAPDQVHLGGDSAGANLAVGTALLARERHGPAPRSLLLIYPCLDLTMSSESWRRYGSGYWLEEPQMRWFVECYLAGRAATDALASPTFAHLHDLPPSHVITAEYDPLRDEGEAFQARLRAAGVQATGACIPGTVHGAAGFQAISPSAATFVAEAASALRGSGVDGEV